MSRLKSMGAAAALLAAALFWLVLSASAQVNASLNGTVMDSSGLPMPEVKVKLASQTT